MPSMNLFSVLYPALEAKVPDEQTAGSHFVGNCSGFSALLPTASGTMFVSATEYRTSFVYV